MSTLSIGPIPTLHVLNVSVTQATTQEYFITILVMLQANSRVLLWFCFFCRSAISGPNLLKKKSVKITNLSDTSMGLLLALLVLHVGGFAYAALPMIVESTEEKRWVYF